MNRVLHIDLDAFFASVEEAENPGLRNQKLVVMGAGERGVVTSANYKARKNGVKAGMPYKKAFSLCPDCTFISANYKIYEDYSREFFKILEEFSPDVEHYSIDEAFIDISRLRYLENSEIELAAKIKREIENKIEISATIGIGDKKVSAKVATKLAKPGGICRVLSEDDFLMGVLISEIPGIGKALSVKFSLIGFERGDDIKRKDFLLWEKIKTGFGSFVIPFERKRLNSLPFQSISRGRTFDRNISEKDKILVHISEFSEEISRTLIKNGLKASSVGIKLRYFNFYEEEFKVKVIPPISNYSDIYAKAKALFLNNYNPVKGKLRAITVFVGDVKKSPIYYLFKPEINKKEAFSSAVFRIKERFGDRIIYPARKFVQI